MKSIEEGIIFIFFYESRENMFRLFRIKNPPENMKEKRETVSIHQKSNVTRLLKKRENSFMLALVEPMFLIISLYSFVWQYKNNRFSKKVN